MTNETAKIKIKILDSFLQRVVDYGESDHEAMMIAIKAIDQQNRIIQILDDCGLEAWEILEKIKEVVRK